MTRSLLESLEPRVLLSIDPSAREQESLELLNRMRLDPQAELDLLLNSNDSNVISALNFFDVDLGVLREQWESLVPAQPLAWNESLINAALYHTGQMRDADLQTHQVPAIPGVRPEEPDLRDRTKNAGYTTSSALGENVFAFVKSMLHAHAAYAIDWGNGPDGIQDPPGHRITIMNPVYREVGISVLDGIPGNNANPMLMTQDFGGPSSFGNSFLLGVVYTDLNKDGRFNAGEGIDDVDIDIVGSGGVFETESMDSGGYQIRLPAGTYTIKARGDGLDKTITFEDVVIGGQNVKLDFKPDPFVTTPPDTTPPVASLDAASITRSGRTSYRFEVNVSDNDAVNVSLFSARDIRVIGPDGFSQTARFIKLDNATNGADRVATYQITPPDGFWDETDNGIYSVRLRSGEVGDVSGNFTAPDTLGEFLVDIESGSAPTAELVANQLKSGGGSSYSFKVIYRDNVAIDVSDLRDGNLRITGPDGYDELATLDKTNANTDGKKRIGYYTIDAPGSAWDFGDNGRYRVYVNAHKINDTEGNYLPPIKVGSISVSIPVPAAGNRGSFVAAPFARNGRLADASEKSEKLSAWDALTAEDPIIA
jgi:hypothetical protein